jgi:hypothetical protein
MRAELTSEALVDGLVTVAVALLMTFAGYEMLESTPSSATQAGAAPAQAKSAVPAVTHARASVAPGSSATEFNCAITMPHVDEIRA